jgi:hypothetical protein
MTITAKVIADSINPWGKRITTFELEFPRIVLPEFNTHRVFSRNAASSRAIPIKAVIEQVKTNPAMPFKFGKNQPGMQAKENLEGKELEAAISVWLAARDSAVAHAEVMADMQLHKQVVNRLLEPFQHIKVVMTTTEYENWKWLRLHSDADPTIYELARVMEEARNESNPVELSEGQWHIPYVYHETDKDQQLFFDENWNVVTVEQALKISASCCAQVSYRKNDGSLEKAELVYNRLVGAEPVHASPLEHQAKALEKGNDSKGITSIGFIDEDCNNEAGIIGAMSSGNFTGGWMQYRQLVPNNTKKDS